MVRGRLFFAQSGAPRVFLPALVAFALSFVVGLALTFALRKTPTELERADTLAESGREHDAEAIYARLARDVPTTEIAIHLVENHVAGVATSVLGDAHKQTMMPEEELDALLDGLPPDIGLVARFWRTVTRHGASAEMRDALVIAAEREPPLAWSNHVLAEEARIRGDLEEAVIRFEREATFFPERAHDWDPALRLRMRLNDWDTVRARLRDPKIRAAVSTLTLHELAAHDEDWLGVAKAVVIGWRHEAQAWALIVSGIAALAWAFVCARLGKLGAAPRRRVPLYLAAFALGVASVVPTLVLIAIEEKKIHLVETGDATRDILFYVFGVGLREEACKLLAFLPLLLVIRRFGDKLDVLVCGAMVGLGFAAEENLGYLASGNLHTGLARFLVANFFHMAMTGTLAAALDELLTDREKFSMPFTKTALMVVGMHGLYDFLLSHPEYGGALFAMLVFIVLTKMFLDAVDRARRTTDRGLTLLHAFTLAIGVVSGVAAVRAVTAAGPLDGLAVLGEGLLGEAIILVVFVRTLRSM